MLSNEQIAHDLALIWVHNALNGKLPQLTEGKHIVDEYLAAYKVALEKLELPDSAGAVQNSQS